MLLQIKIGSVDSGSVFIVFCCVCDTFIIIISPVFKQGFFALQGSLVCSVKKSCLRCKEALFENGGKFHLYRICFLVVFVGFQFTFIDCFVSSLILVFIRCFGVIRKEAGRFVRPLFVCHLRSFAALQFIRFTCCYSSHTR